MKRTEHIIDPTDILLNEWELQLVMGDYWKDLNVFTHNIFCTCGGPGKHLIDFKPYLTDLNDVVLRGTCSGCHTIAARYIETGENPETVIVAERIRKVKAGIKKSN